MLDSTWGARLLVGVSVLLAVAAPTSAQDVVQPTRFTFYGTAGGLSNSAVTVLAQDSVGYVWVSTADGLNRFEGQRFVTHRRQPRDVTSLPGSRISVWGRTMHSLVPGRPPMPGAVLRVPWIPTATSTSSSEAIGR